MLKINLNVNSWKFRNMAKPKRKVISVYVPQDLYEELALAAESSLVNLSSWVAVAAKQRLQREREEKQEKLFKQLEQS
jgi:metal-responsive CopG/Arc/MetJ family transcriptional regulator